MTNTPPDTGTPDPTEYPVGHYRNPAPGLHESADVDDVPFVGGTPEELAKEVQKWRELSRKHEDRAKANSAAAKELETLREQTMTDVEKAVTVARAEGRVEAVREVGAKLVAAELRAAAAGRNVDVDALLEGLDRSLFIGEDGDPNREAILAWMDRVAPRPDPTAPAQPSPFDLGQGHRPDPSTALNSDPLLADLKRKLGVA